MKKSLLLLLNLSLLTSCYATSPREHPVFDFALRYTQSVQAAELGKIAQYSQLPFYFEHQQIKSEETLRMYFQELRPSSMYPLKPLSTDSFSYRKMPAGITESEWHRYFKDLPQAKRLSVLLFTHDNPRNPEISLLFLKPAKEGWQAVAWSESLSDSLYQAYAESQQG